jgi:glycosyltransferase involved in cell wall biosynthesis
VIRIAIIGPVEPFRSGVARHTTALARALSRRRGASVSVYSFSRQYPALLFPGESDRASDAKVPADLDTRFCIDSVNPLSWLGVARDIRATRPDLVVVPMWTFFLAPCLTALLAGMRCPVIAVVHNVVDHEAGRLRALVSALPLRRADAYVTHTEALAHSIRQLISGARVVVHPHPVFDYPAAVGALPRRAPLELLMFGLLRPYKGLDVLLEALAACKTRSPKLSVVGECWQSPAIIQQQVARLDLEHRVELVLRYVPDAEAAEYFQRADIVMLPYRTVTGSGVLPLAFHYERPVVASDLPGFRELIAERRTGWLVPPGDPAALARLIDEELSRETAIAMQQNVRDTRRRLSFDHFASTLLGAAGIQHEPEARD